MSSKFINFFYKNIKFSFSGGGGIYTNNNNRIPKNYKPGYNQNKPPNSINQYAPFNDNDDEKKRVKLYLFNK